MKKLLLGCLLLTGCSATGAPVPELDPVKIQDAIQKQTAVINMIGEYLSALQAKKVLPTFEQLEKMK